MENITLSGYIYNDEMFPMVIETVDSENFFRVLGMYLFIIEFLIFIL